MVRQRCGIRFRFPHLPGSYRMAPSRTPAGSRASSRHASIFPRTTWAHSPLAGDAPQIRSHRSIPARPTQREPHASHEQSLTRLPLELLNSLHQIPAHELRVPINLVQRARHEVFLCRVDRPGEWFHLSWQRFRLRRRPERFARRLAGDDDSAPGPARSTN